MRAAQFSSSAALARLVLAALVVLGLVGAAPLANVGSVTAAPAEPQGLRAVADAGQFTLGAGVDADHLGDAAFERLLIDNVNTVSTLDELSFAAVQPTQGTFDFTRAEAIVDFAVANDLRVRGHDLITPDLLPTWVTEGSWTPETLRDVLTEHVATVVGHFAQRNPGVITQWDVVARSVLGDGTRRPSIWQNVIGDEYVNAAFTAARDADPAATLFYDDFYDDFSITQDEAVGAESVTSGATASRTTCDLVAKCVGVNAMVVELLDADVPIDGVGFQAHLFSPEPADFSKFSRWVDDLGLEWAITEFDVPLPATEVDDPTTLDFQASVYEAAFGSCLDSASCDTVVTWGITDRLSPIASETGGAFGGALWFDEQDTPKPAYDAIAAALSAEVPTTAPVDSVAPEPSPVVDEDGDGSGAIVVASILAGAALAAAAAVALRRRRGA